MLSVTHGRGAAVGGAGACEKPGYRECRTRWRSKYRHVVSIRATLQQTFVDGVHQDIVRASSAM
eukprot:4144026-Pleurochrysis_carterae.AAC.1